MTSKIYRPCSGSSSCPEAGTVRGRCPDHAAEHEARRNLERTENLDVYRSTRWRRERRTFLRSNPWCSWPQCFDAATDVDHDQPIGSGVDPFDQTNWRGLCHRHHSKKTATENRSRARRTD